MLYGLVYLFHWEPYEYMILLYLLPERETEGQEFQMTAYSFTADQHQRRHVNINSWVCDTEPRSFIAIPMLYRILYAIQDP